MPWSSGDVEKHKKGLSPAEKEKWCSIANGVLKSCQEKGGTDCEASAIRIANSRVGPTGNVESARRAVIKYVETYGGEGSGHWGHAGIPGHQGGSAKDDSNGKEPELTKEDKLLMADTDRLLSDGFKSLDYKGSEERGREVADLLNGTSIFEGTVFSSHFSGFQVKDGKYVSLYFPGISVGSGETNARMQRAVAYLNKNGVKARIVDDINFRGIVCNSEQVETYGGEGSGHFGHAGRPGKVGGSADDGDGENGEEGINPEKRFPTKIKDSKIREKRNEFIGSIPDTDLPMKYEENPATGAFSVSIENRGGYHFDKFGYNPNDGGYFYHERYSGTIQNPKRNDTPWKFEAPGQKHLSFGNPTEKAKAAAAVGFGSWAIREAVFDFIESNKKKVQGNNSEQSKQTDLESYALLQDNTLMRTKILEGRKHLVLPVVMMVEGVHNGSHGRLLHLSEELGKFPGSWDGIPVMVGHPQKDGQNISANSPDVIERSVGRVYNTQMVGGKLKAEVWVDEQKIQSISPEAMEYIRKGSPLEVSVGVFTDEQLENGDWKGEAYVAVAKNHRPDHLALLPGDRGACSWDDGCGIRTNKGKWEQDDEENSEDKKKDDEEEEKRPFDKALEKFKDKSKKKKFPAKAIEKFNEIKRR